MSFFIYADKFDPQHVHFGPTQCEHSNNNNNNSNSNNNNNSNSNSNNNSNSSNNSNNNNSNTNHNSNNNKFSRITYSTNHISLNNVGFVLSDASVASLVRVECAILDKYVLQLRETRRPVHSIAAHSAASTDTTLAIYGVWETHDECGLVYKGSK